MPRYQTFSSAPAKNFHKVQQGQNNYSKTFFLCKYYFLKLCKNVHWLILSAPISGQHNFCEYFNLKCCFCQNLPSKNFYPSWFSKSLENPPKTLSNTKFSLRCEIQNCFWLLLSLPPSQFHCYCLRICENLLSGGSDEDSTLCCL